MTQGHRQETGRDWVLLEWDGTIRCPWHGTQPAGTEYFTGIAPCGCMWVPAPAGVLRAKRQDASLTKPQDTGYSEPVQTGASCTEAA